MKKKIQREKKRKKGEREKKTEEINGITPQKEVHRTTNFVIDDNNKMVDLEVVINQNK
jgi:hypothetical protein